MNQTKKLIDRVKEIPKTEPLDCGDSSCRFATNRDGMRTNGGCRCHNNPGPILRRRHLRLEREAPKLARMLEVAISHITSVTNDDDNELRDTALKEIEAIAREE